MIDSKKVIQIIIFQFILKFKILVDTQGAGSGALSVSIRAAGNEVKHTLRELNGSNLYQVVYNPELSVPHKIHVKYNGIYVSGSY